MIVAIVTAVILFAMLKSCAYFLQSGGDNSENVEKAIGNIPGLGLAASNGSCFSPPSTDEGPRTWLALDLGVDWDSVKRVRQ